MTPRPLLHPTSPIKQALQSHTLSLNNTAKQMFLHKHLHRRTKSTTQSIQLNTNVYMLDNNKTNISIPNLVTASVKSSDEESNPCTTIKQRTNSKTWRSHKFLKYILDVTTTWNTLKSLISHILHHDPKLHDHQTYRKPKNIFVPMATSLS